MTGFPAIKIHDIILQTNAEFCSVEFILAMKVSSFILLCLNLKTVICYVPMIDHIENCTSFNEEILTVQMCDVGSDGDTLEIKAIFQRPVDQLTVRQS